MSSLMEIISFTCFILIINSVANNADERVGPKESRGQLSALRRLDCTLFCKKTGFSGIVGGCQCGFTLFSSKRSETNNNGNIGLSSANKLNGNTYSRNLWPILMKYGFNRYSNDDNLKSNFLIPLTTRTFGHI